eukprot:2696550-Pleurochrysis_carterae.AAC.1
MGEAWVRQREGGMGEGVGRGPTAGLAQMQGGEGWQAQFVTPTSTSGLCCCVQNAFMCWMYGRRGSRLPEMKRAHSEHVRSTYAGLAVSQQRVVCVKLFKVRTHRHSLACAKKRVGRVSNGAGRARELSGAGRARGGCGDRTSRTRRSDKPDAAIGRGVRQRRNVEAPRQERARERKRCWRRATRRGCESSSCFCRRAKAASSCGADRH